MKLDDLFQMLKSSMLLFFPLLFSAGCAQIKSAGTIDDPVTSTDALTVQRQLVKELDVQQRTDGNFELCHETGVWKCKVATKKTLIISAIVTKSIVLTAGKESINLTGPTEEVLNGEWLIQVGAYKTEGAIDRALNALSLMGVSYAQEMIGDLTLVRVTGFLTKDAALRDLSNYDDVFENPFVLKSY